MISGATQWSRVYPHEVWRNVIDLLFDGQETVLVVS